MNFMLIETVSNSLLSLIEITRIVLLLAFNQVEGRNVLIIGSSLYSLVIKTHISTDSFCIILGNKFSVLSFIILSIIIDLSFNVSISCG